MTEIRESVVIAAEAAEMLANSSKTFVPAPILKMQDLAVEFMGAASRELVALRAELDAMAEVLDQFIDAPEADQAASESGLTLEVADVTDEIPGA